MQLDSVQLNKIPKDSYLVVPKKTDEEDHIIQKKRSTGARIMADKLVKNAAYVTKGMSGSKNSNFYEFLSMGLIPNIAGSAVLILLSNLLCNKTGGIDSFFSRINGRKVGCGVVLFAVGKWLGKKIINKGVEKTTGVDLENPYKKFVHTIPESAGDESQTMVEFHTDLESVDFPRFDLKNKQGTEHGNRFEYHDKIAKKMGYKNKLDASDQETMDAVKEVAVKTKAATSISSYIWAALGCTVAAQEPFGKFMNFRKRTTFFRALKALPDEIWRTMKGGIKATWHSNVGKGLIIAALASSMLGILNANRGFRVKNTEPKSTIDYNKNYTES